jgi:polar amino acid transport system permease protein
MSLEGAPSALQLDRDRYRHKQSVRSVLVAAGSTAVLGLVMFLVIVRSSGWARVQADFLNPHYAGKHFGAIMRGLWLNLRMVVVCEVAILLLGLAIALARTLRGPIFFPVRALAAVYTDVFRGMPLIVLLYIIGFGVPGLQLRGVPKSAAILGGVAIVLTYSAYVAEVCAPEPARGRSVLGAFVFADDAPRRRTPSRASGVAAAAERLRGAAEGHRAHLGAGCS